MANDLRTEDLQVLFDNYIDKMEDLSEHVSFLSMATPPVQTFT